jgi:hypothetical protein
VIESNAGITSIAGFRGFLVPDSSHGHLHDTENNNDEGIVDEFTKKLIPVHMNGNLFGWHQWYPNSVQNIVICI